MNRRSFISRSAQVSMLSVLPAASLTASSPQIQLHKTTDPLSLLPKKLKKGDTVGLIAPGYSLSAKALENAKSNVRAMGFKPYHTSRIIGHHGYFSNTDKMRAEDVHEMFLDPEVDGIFCARGGYGCTRILDQINYDYIAQNPKVLVGFSDITALANAIHHKTGLITFHGPVGTTLDNEYNRRNLYDVISKSSQVLNLPAEHYSSQTILSDDTFEQYVINPGEATAQLIGGNLSLLSAMCGTNFDLDYTGKLVFIEDIDEDPYRIDRMFTQLLSSPTFKHAAGIVLGVFKGCNDPRRVSFSLKEVILDRIKSLNVPSIYGYSIGHIDHNLTLPIGIKASLNTETFSIELKERAVQD